MSSMHVHLFHLPGATIRKAALFTLLPLVCSLAPLFLSSCSLPWEKTTQAITCGTVTSTEASSNNAPKAMDAGACFFQAYQKCQAALFIYIDQDTFISQDTEKTTRIFTIDTTTCKVLEVVQVQSTSETYTCDNMESLRGFLILDACGADGTFSLALDIAIQ